MANLKVGDIVSIITVKNLTPKRYLAPKHIVAELNNKSGLFQFPVIRVESGNYVNIGAPKNLKLDGSPAPNMFSSWPEELLVKIEPRSTISNPNAKFLGRFKAADLWISKNTLFVTNLGSGNEYTRNVFNAIDYGHDTTWDTALRAAVLAGYLNDNPELCNIEKLLFGDL